MKHSAVRIGLVVVLSLAASGQSPTFDVADIHPARNTNAAPGKGGFSASGRVDLPNLTVKQMIIGAFGVQEDMVTGGPKWIETDRWDIVAKAPPSTSHTDLDRMYQALLTERFKLAIHREEKPLPGYALVRGKRELKLQPSSDGVPGQPDCKWQTVEGGRMQRICHNMTMTELAQRLPGWGPTRVDRPVVDESGLKGPYDFVLEISATVGKKPQEHAADMADITVFDAFERVGLRLESRKIPLQTIVIDHVEKAAEN